MSSWYVLYTSSGNEKKIKNMLEDQISRYKMHNFFEEILVPSVEVPQLKRGKKVLVEKKIMPGYILIKMIMSDSALDIVKGVAKYSGFLGNDNIPKALSEKEVENIFSRLQKESQNVNLLSPYNIGDKIEILDGPFEAFAGIVESVDLENEKLKISVAIFGKTTPITLKFSQVNKFSS